MGLYQANRFGTAVGARPYGTSGSPLFEGKRTRMLIAAVCFLLGVFLLVWRGPMPLEGTIRAFARMDAWDQAVALADNPETLHRYYSLSMAVVFLFAGALVFCGAVWASVSEAYRGVIYSGAITLAISCALIIYLARMQFEGPWLPIHTIVQTPSALPIFGHRLLFVWLARAFEKLSPKVSDLRGFYLSQCVVILLAVYALGKWSAIHIGKSLAWVGQLIGAMLISTSFGYYNFYDIGTVFFTTCGLIILYRRSYWWLVPLVAVATLNYEGIVLLIPVAAFLAYDKLPARRWAPPLAAALLAYAAVRFSLQAAIPFPRQVDWRIWSNMAKPFLLKRDMAFAVLALGGWYAVGLLSIRYCDQRLKRLILLFPLVFGVTIVFGQLQEPRQFDAFIPVIVAMILSASRRRLEAEIRSTAETESREAAYVPQPAGLEPRDYVR